MKIKIKTADIHLNLRIPNSLLLWDIPISIALHYTKDTIELSRDQRKKIVKLLRECSRKYKGLTLIEVDSSEGERIEITL